MVQLGSRKRQMEYSGSWQHGYAMWRVFFSDQISSYHILSDFKVTAPLYRAVRGQLPTAFWEPKPGHAAKSNLCATGDTGSSSSPHPTPSPHPFRLPSSTPPTVSHPTYRLPPRLPPPTPPTVSHPTPRRHRFYVYFPHARDFRGLYGCW